MSNEFMTLKMVLKTLYDSGQWGDYHTKSFDLMKQYIENYSQRYANAQHYLDKSIISDNIKGQVWYQMQNSSIRTVLSQLLEQMSVVKEFCVNQPESKMLTLKLDFKGFQLNVFYFQQLNELINLQINVNRGDKVNYLAYNVRGRVVGIPGHIKSKIKVPELDDLNDLVGINSSMLPPEILLNLFLEIVLYYDQTETIGQLRLVDEGELTICEITESVINMVERNS